MHLLLACLETRVELGLSELLVLRVSAQMD